MHRPWPAARRPRPGALGCFRRKSGAYFLVGPPSQLCNARIGSQYPIQRGSNTIHVLGGINATEMPAYRRFAGFDEAREPVGVFLIMAAPHPKGECIICDGDHLSQSSATSSPVSTPCAPATTSVWHVRRSRQHCQPAPQGADSFALVTQHMVRSHPRYWPATRTGW